MPIIWASNDNRHGVVTESLDGPCPLVSTQVSPTGGGVVTWTDPTGSGADREESDSDSGKIGKSLVISETKLFHCGFSDDFVVKVGKIEE